MFPQFNLPGAGLLQSALQVCGALFVVCAVVPNVRATVFGWTDKVRTTIFPSAAPAPTVTEIADELEKRLKAAK